VSERRKLVPCFEKRDIPTRRACELIGISRRRLKYASKKNDADLVDRLKTLARAHPRFGVRQLWRQVRRRGVIVNLKRVRRLCRRHGLLLKQRRRRKRLGIGAGLPCRAEHPNHVWSYDFVEDRTETGRKLRILTIVDEFTRRCVELEVEYRMNAKFVARALLKQFQVHGVPRFIRSDNGPEFIARFLMNVLKLHGVEARHIDPGSPWQNGIDERFNGTLRDECLNMETFHGRDHARAVIRLWGRFYNADRPHSSLGSHITPQEFYEQCKREHASECTHKDGSAGGGGAGLSHGAPPACAKSSRPILANEDRPASRQAIHVGAPVAPQQSRILRVDEASVAAEEPAGTYPARKTTPN
jgi:putative transposase